MKAYSQEDFAAKKAVKREQGKRARQRTNETTKAVTQRVIISVSPVVGFVSGASAPEA